MGAKVVKQEPDNQSGVAAVLAWGEHPVHCPCRTEVLGATL